MSDAVIIVDMLNDFVHGELAAERAERIIPNIYSLSKEARKKDIPVIYSGDAHRKEDFELKVWGEHAMKGTKGAETIPELEPKEKDHVFEKRTYDAFHGTGLDDHLRSLNVDRTIITGLHTNICCRHTSASAFFRGYDISIPKDCVDAFDKESHKRGLEYLEEIYNADITTYEKLIENWSDR